MNPNARTETVEVLMNPAELSKLDAMCKAIGVAKSTFLRGLSNNAVRLHGSPPAPPRESRHCRGMRPATRGAFVTAHRPLRV